MKRDTEEGWIERVLREAREVREALEALQKEQSEQRKGNARGYDGISLLTE